MFDGARDGHMATGGQRRHVFMAKKTEHSDSCFLVVAACSRPVFSSFCCRATSSARGLPMGWPLSAERVFPDDGNFIGMIPTGGSVVERIVGGPEHLAGSKELSIQHPHVHLKRPVVPTRQRTLLHA